MNIKTSQKFSTFLALTLALSILSCKDKIDTKNIAQKGESSQSKVNSTLALKFVRAEYVCMTQDAVYPEKLIPIKANGKTYYGCCQGCAKSIKAEPEKYRFSRDPISNARVDKAEAIILNFKGKALYFESEKNARKFSRQHGV